MTLRMGKLRRDTFSLLDMPGLAGLSPLEMRQVDEREKLVVVSIFGCGVHKQQNLTKLDDNVKKKALQKAMLETFMKQD